jgi:hypothetical protein
MGAFRPVRIFFKPFRQGLAENGYFEAKNVTLDWEVGPKPLRDIKRPHRGGPARLQPFRLTPARR